MSGFRQTDDGVTVSCADGRELEADLLVGARQGDAARLERLAWLLDHEPYEDGPRTIYRWNATESWEQ